MSTAKKDTVTIRLPIGRDKQDDVFVSVNNRTWQIQRGKAVEVPACVEEVLRHSEEMAAYAANFDALVRNAN